MALDLSAIKVKVQADTKEAEGSLERLKKTGESLSDIGQKLTMGITAPIVAAGTASLMAASDVAEMESKFDTVFKNLSEEADSWATTYADAIGRSKYEIKEAISNQSDLYQGMGFTADEAFELSKQVTTLGYDLASFNNVNDDQAVEAMTKALMGETESAKMLGVNLTDTIMETSEFTKATGKSWSELSMAEKAQVRYQEAVKQSQNAIGDAEATAGSFTNMTKRLKGQLNEFAVEIGKVLLPIAQKVVEFLSGALDKITTFVKENPKMAQTIVMVAAALAAIGPGMFIVGKLMALFAAFPVVMAGVGIALGLAALAFIGLNEKAQETLSQIPEKLGTMIDTAMTKLIEFLPGFLEKGTELIMNLVTGIVNAIPVVLQTIVDLGFMLFEKLFEYGPQLVQIGWDFIQNLLDGLIANYPQLLGNFMDKITEIINNIKDRMPEFIAKGVEFVSNLAKGFKDNFPEIMDKVGQLLKDMIAKIIEKLPDFLKAGWDLLKSIVKGLWDNREEINQAGKDVLSGLWEGLKSAVSTFLDIGGMIVDAIKDGISSAWGGLTSWVSSKLSNIPLAGGLFKMVPEIDDSGMVAPTADMLVNPLARGGLLSMPQLFGATSSSKSFEFKKDTSVFDGLKEAIEGLKGANNTGVIENVINIDGREFARITTPYISRELAWATR